MVLEKVKALIAEQFDIDEDTISADTSFEELGADSIDIAELVAAVEDEFDIKVLEDSLEGISTVDDVVRCVKKNRPRR